MPTTKLTLSTDRKLLAKAKKLAAKEGTSLSSMFARFLQALLQTRNREEQPGPITSQATGLAKLPAGKNDQELLTESLAERYGL